MNLRKPYSFETSVTEQWIKSILISCFVFLFLLVFQPFGLNSLQKNIVVITLGYGITCLVVMVILNVALVSAFQNYFLEKNWTSLKQLIWAIINMGIIGIANAIYSAYIGVADFTLQDLFRFEVFTLAVGVFPIGAFILINQARLNDKFQRQSKNINANLGIPKERIGAKKVFAESDTPIEVIIPSENGRENFSVPPDELLFIHSSDNYIEVFYFNNSRMNCKLIRNSLKAAAISLNLNENFFRVHKSYIVNLSKVKHVSGNAQGYKLHLADTEVTIPVSRRLNEIIKNKLTTNP